MSRLKTAWDIAADEYSHLYDRSSIDDMSYAEVCELLSYVPAKNYY
jgi:hypothetical protein